MQVIVSLSFDNVTSINLFIFSYRRPQGLCSSRRMLKLSLTSYFKYFVIINFARETNALLVGDLLTGLLYLYRKQAN